MKTEDWLNCVGAGWHGIVRPLVEYAQSHGVTIQQVKEKFGGLRFYVTGSDRKLDAMIEAAEHQSLKVCEDCGQPGRPRGGGWVRTLCDDHAKDRK